MEHLYTLGAAYFAAINLFAIGLPLRDKRAARRKKWRISERTLLTVSLLGGAAAMLITMCLIRHKTRHAKFMVGIPVILLLQITAAVLIFWWQKGGTL